MADTSVLETLSTDEVHLTLIFPLGTRSAAEVANEVSVAVIEEAGTVAKETQRRIKQTYSLYTLMLFAMFAVGISSFVAALWQSFVPATGDSVVRTAIYGGLSATTLVTVFLSKPLRAMARSGPESAWVLAIVNTYWTKLAYLKDPVTVIADLEAAEAALDKSLSMYLHSTSREDQPPRSASQRRTSTGARTKRAKRAWRSPASEVFRPTTTPGGDDA